jgi:hypothetical protein
MSGDRVDEDDDYDFDDLAEFDDPPDPEIEQVVLFDPEEDDDLAEFDETLLNGESTVAAPEPAEVGFSRSNKRPSALIATPATKTSEAIRRTLISGHCATPQTTHPEESHGRCKGYTRANPDKIFQPCPDVCHFTNEDGVLVEYECSGCGGTIVEAPHYPLDEDGDVRYVHLNKKTNRVTDCECPS